MTLSDFRTQKNLTLRDVAERMGCAHGTVLKIERADNPRVKTLLRYAEAVGVSTSEILSYLEIPIDTADTLG